MAGRGERRWGRPGWGPGRCWRRWGSGDPGRDGVEATIEATGTRERRRWRLPSTAAIVQARQRAGARLLLLRELLRAVARPIATGTHVIRDAVIRPCRSGDLPTALRLLRSVGPGMLLLWDRGFHSYALVRATLRREAPFLGRAKRHLVLRLTEVLTDRSFLARIYPSPTARRRDPRGLEVRVVEYALDRPAGPGRQTYRLITSLLDERAFPAQPLAATCHER